MRNGILAALAVVFSALYVAILGGDFNVPGLAMLGLAIALLLLGLALVFLTIRGEETGKRRFFLVATGVCAVAIPVTAILHNFIFHAFFFVLGVLVFPLIFVIVWVASVLLLATAEKPVTPGRKLLIGLVVAIGLVAIVRAIMMIDGEDDYEVTSEVVGTPQEEVRRMFVTIDVDDALMDVVYPSFEHSLVAALESNGITATVGPPPGESDGTAETGAAAESFGADATMHIIIEPLYRKHREGFEAIVGTVFAVGLVEMQTAKPVWQMSGKVDYVVDRFFDQPGYATSHGMKQEFAWHTTAAIVRTCMRDVYGRESVPIYTSTEQRARKGQRTD